MITPQAEARELLDRLDAALKQVRRGGKGFVPHKGAVIEALATALTGKQINYRLVMEALGHATLPPQDSSGDARELLAGACETPEGSYAERVRQGRIKGLVVSVDHALRAIEAALSRQDHPVPNAMRDALVAVRRQLLNSGYGGPAVDRALTMAKAALASRSAQDGWVLAEELRKLRVGIEQSGWHNIPGGRAKRILVAESAIERIDQALAAAPSAPPGEGVRMTCKHDFEAINQWQTVCRKCGTDLDSIAAPSGSDLGEGVVERLSEALAPFARLLRHDDDRISDAAMVVLTLGVRKIYGLSLRDLRRARDVVALSASSPTVTVDAVRDQAFEEAAKVAEEVGQKEDAARIPQRAAGAHMAADAIRALKGASQ